MASTKRGLRGLVVDCLLLALVGLAAMALVGCAGGDPIEPRLVWDNRTSTTDRGRVVELDHDSIPDLVVVKVRLVEKPAVHDVGAIAPVSEGLEIGDIVQLHWTQIFNTTSIPHHQANQFRRATKVRNNPTIQDHR